MEDVDGLVLKAQSKVSSTISALEAAIASWEAMENKPEKYADTIAGMKRLIPRLEAWEVKSLRNSRAPAETKRKDLAELVSISESSKGDF